MDKKIYFVSFIDKEISNKKIWIKKFTRLSSARRAVKNMQKNSNIVFKYIKEYNLATQEYKIVEV